MIDSTLEEAFKRNKQLEEQLRLVERRAIGVYAAGYSDGYAAAMENAAVKVEDMLERHVSGQDKALGGG